MGPDRRQGVGRGAARELGCVSVQRYVKAGRVRYRARVKHHGREVATQVFDRKNDALVWEAEQRRRLRLGEWIDPRRGRVPLSRVADDWFESRHSVKRKTMEADRAAWRSHIADRFGGAPVASITPAEIAHWVGSLISRGCSPSTAARYLATLRSILAFAVADGRVSINAAAAVRAPTAGHVRREGQYLTRQELDALALACRGVYADVVKVLGLAGLRWGELAGLRVGDRIAVPGPGLRLQRSVLASSKRGDLFVDTLKGKRSRTVPLVAALVPLVNAWASGKQVPPGCSRPLGAARSASRTGSVQSDGRPRATRSTGRPSGSTICDTPAPRSGWAPARIPRSSKGSAGTPPRQ
jgi:integrase